MKYCVSRPVELISDTSMTAFTSEAESEPMLPLVPLIFTDTVSALMLFTTYPLVACSVSSPTNCTSTLLKDCVIISSCVPVIYTQMKSEASREMTAQRTLLSNSLFFFFLLIAFSP